MMANISRDLLEALETFSRHRPILIALDFDGTLAPLGDDPEASRMIPEARAALDALTEVSGVDIALVTGRAIDSILQVASPHPSWYLVGSHGIEVVSPSQRVGYHTPQAPPAGLVAGFDQILLDFPGSRKEIKPFGVALHTRGMPVESARAAEQAAHTLCEQWHGDLVVRTGHGIVECSVEFATKGDGIIAVREAVAARATLFAGDDATDEDGFGVLGSGDIGIRVGGGDTIAPYRLDNAESVAEALWLLYAQTTAA
jgi:trehalose 6-phosphate phosphatase